MTKEPPPSEASMNLVRDAWVDALKHEQFGDHDDFFTVWGAHSLLIAQIMGTLSNAQGRRIPLRLFLDNPTVAELAAQMDGRPA